MPQMGESVTEGTILEWHKREGEFVEEGESVAEGTVLEWHKQAGDSVAAGETVVEVSTEKIDAEVPAPASGTITKILIQPDETVQVGEALAEMAAGAATPPKPAGQERATDREPAAATPVSAEGADGKRASPVARR